MGHFASERSVMAASREIHLVKRPIGVAKPDDFAVVEVATPDAGEGEIQIQNLIMSVDPYMRPRLNADQGLNSALLGGGIGRVTASRNPRFAEGDLVPGRAAIGRPPCREIALYLNRARRATRLFQAV